MDLSAEDGAAVETDDKDTLDELPESSVAQPQPRITIPHKFSIKKRILNDPFAASFARKISVTTSTFALAKYFQCCRDRMHYVAMRIAANLICYRMLARGIRLKMNRRRAACTIQTKFRGAQLRQRLKSSVSISLVVRAPESPFP
jgi:hypothetical protein